VRTQRTAELCSQTTRHLIERADCLDQRRRLWRIFEVIAAGLGIFTQISTATQFFRGDWSWVPLLVAIFFAFWRSLVPRFTKQTSFRTHPNGYETLHYIYYYADQLSFYLEHRKDDTRLILIGRFEELLRLAHKNLDDARQKWSWAVRECPERNLLKNDGQGSAC
jgi:hypothetical protein